MNTITDWLQSDTLAPVADTLMGAAYEQTPARHRSCLKNGIAMHYALWTDRATHSTTFDTVHGFTFSRKHTPAPWAIICFTPEYAAPSRLVAAVMPAVMATVPCIVAICVGGEPHPATCIALELMGIEHIYTTSMAALLPRIPLLAQCGNGRLLALHNGSFANMRTHAFTHRLQYWEESTPPHICYVAGTPDSELLAWMHPDTLPTETTTPNVSAAEAIVSNQTALPAHSPLQIGGGMEGCWLHEQLFAAYFYNTTWGISACGADNE